MNTHLDYRPYQCKNTGTITYMCAEHFGGTVWLYDGFTYYPAENFFALGSECRAA